MSLAMEKHRWCKSSDICATDNNTIVVITLTCHICWSRLSTPHSMLYFIYMLILQMKHCLIFKCWQTAAQVSFEQVHCIIQTTRIFNHKIIPVQHSSTPHSKCTYNKNMSGVPTSSSVLQYVSDLLKSRLTSSVQNALPEVPDMGNRWQSNIQRSGVPQGPLPLRAAVADSHFDLWGKCARVPRVCMFFHHVASLCVGESRLSYSDNNIWRIPVNTFRSIAAWDRSWGFRSVGPQSLTNVLPFCYGCSWEPAPILILWIEWVIWY